MQFPGPRRPANKNSPGLLLAAFRKSSTAWRVCSLNSNLTGRLVFLCRTVARSAVDPPAATSSTRMATTSQPRSLLSIARLNMARASAAFNLELRSDRPDVFGSQWRLRPGQLPFVPRRSLGCDGRIHLILHGHTPRLGYRGREACVNGLSVGIRSVFGPKRTSRRDQRQTT